MMAAAITRFAVTTRRARRDSRMTAGMAARSSRQRLSRRMADGAGLGLSLEALTAANLPYLPQK